MNNRSSRKLVAMLVAGVLINQAQGHGYVSNPPARSFLCRQGVNTGCGAIQYEPQSLEGPSGFPTGGPADGRIASAGLNQFGELDEQTYSRWSKQTLSAGTRNFTWTFTANHVTRNWRYYITRPDWNPNRKLARSAFESVPFCVVDGRLQQPALTVTHPCNVPPRLGYQVILSVWEIGDTNNSFYSVIDADFGGGGTSPPVTPTWEPKGTINPSVDLPLRDVVSTRVFDARSERDDLATRFEITEASEGRAANWPYHLATRINLEQTLLRAGQRSATGEISPVTGQNQVFARSDGGIVRVEVQVDKADPETPAEFGLSGLESRYLVQAGKVTLAFTIDASTDMDLAATLYSGAGAALAALSKALTPGSQAVDLVVDPAPLGNHQLVLVAKDKSNGSLIQKTYPVTFEPQDTGSPVRYDYVFPKGLLKYKAGTRVLQPRDGQVYECKAWPYSGFCVQWSASATQFEPGVGSDWREAWLAR
jgi:chitin-binding protein